MVIVHVKRKGSSEWARESFLDPRHYIKWRTLTGSKIVAVRPIGGVKRA